jgi:hypothetical protein
MRRPPSSRGPIVYFIQAGEDGPIKIGTTTGWAETRMAAMQTGCPQKLRFLCYVPGGPDVEARLHGRFSSYRLQGEWFDPSESLVDYINSIKAGVARARSRKLQAQLPPPRYVVQDGNLVPTPEYVEQCKVTSDSAAKILDALGARPLARTEAELPLLPRIRRRS